MNIFDKLTKTIETRPVTFLRGTRSPGTPATDHSPEITGQFVADEDHEPITMDLREMTSDEQFEVQAIGMKVVPPIKTKKVRSPDNIGMIDVPDGYQKDDPDYLVNRLKANLKQDCLTCLFGCPELKEKTPGESLEEKIDVLMKKIPHSIIVGMAIAITSLQHNGDFAEVFTKGESSDSKS